MNNQIILESIIAAIRGCDSIEINAESVTFYDIDEIGQNLSLVWTDQRGGDHSVDISFTTLVAAKYEDGVISGIDEDGDQFSLALFDNKPHLISILEIQSPNITNFPQS